MKIFLGLFLVLYSFSSVAQPEKNKINFIPTINGAELELNKSYFLPSINDSIKIETLKFYISAIQFYYDEKQTFIYPTKYILIDMENTTTVSISIPKKKKFNRIKFNIGIDSLTNVSGALGGDLDPTKGMYWTWQSGYINFKLEGFSKVCSTKKNQFQFHIGGYQFPFNTLNSVDLQLKNSETIFIEIDKLIESIDISKTAEIMSPSEKSVSISKKIATHFVTK